MQPLFEYKSHAVRILCSMHAPTDEIISHQALSVSGCGAFVCINSSAVDLAFCAYPGKIND